MKVQQIVGWDEIPETENIILLCEKISALGFQPTQMEYLDLRIEVDENGVVIGYEIETARGTIDAPFNFAGWIDDIAREKAAV